MTREEFLGNPKIVRGIPTKAFVPKLTEDASLSDPEPFISTLTIRRGSKTFVVMDGEIPVASYDGHVLMVAESYRGRGIATELVYDLRTRKPWIPPAKVRTPAAQRVQEKAWERIKREGMR